MKVVILAGGYGSRLSEYTKVIPKPMVLIGGIPILRHIMQIYLNQGFNDFYIALGYKGEAIKKYFSQLTNNQKKNIFTINSKKYKYKVTLLETGKNSMTGGRLKKFEKIIGKNDFMFTYGDGLANINLKKLLKFHISHKKVGTVTTVRPPARFGALTLKRNQVTKFKEKFQLNEGWINGGFFVFNYKIFRFIQNNSTVLEKKPLENLAKQNQFYAYKHYGFWNCMDTKRDKENLEKIYKKKKIPWLN